MTTRQYIGARYVPIFDGDWDNTKAYDPLVIVSYQGNSYTSRTYVPAGIDINNATYWALTGNYNAQVEAYRQEVLRYSDLVSDDVLPHLTDIINVVENGVDNTGTEDVSVVLNTLFNDNNLINRVFYFPDGTYNFDNSVEVNNNASIILSPHAILKATSSIDYILGLNTVAEDAETVALPYYKYSRRFVTGGIFDADHKASACLRMRQYFNTTINDVTFYNIECAIDTDTAFGSEVNGQGAECLFSNIRIQNDRFYESVSTGFKIKNDNILQDVFFYNVSNPIIATGSNIYNNIHAWVDNTTLSDISVMFTLSGDHDQLTNIYCDSIPCVVNRLVNGYTNIVSLRFYLQSPYGNDYTGAIFKGTGTLNLSNIVLQSATNHTFNEAGITINTLYGFSSQGNRCLPYQPNIDNARWQSYTNSRAITTLQGIQSGFYAGRPIGRPTGVGDNPWFYFIVRKLTDEDYFMIAIQQDGLIYTRVGHWDRSVWYASDGTTSPAITS